MSPNANSNWSALGHWSKGKSCDTFNPLGPWLTIGDELPDVSKLRMTLTVNGQLRQNGSTETMIFPPAQIVHYISQFMTLEPGDLISTGTLPGVDLGMNPPRYLSMTILSNWRCSIRENKDRVVGWYSPIRAPGLDHLYPRFRPRHLREAR
jgi:2-keto-4-pentenoate hydratase/2-oxohepta-3-ene-1,7-dioic acid hydratase in catechol pathway